MKSSSAIWEDEKFLARYFSILASVAVSKFNSSVSWAKWMPASICLLTKVVPESTWLMQVQFPEAHLPLEVSLNALTHFLQDGFFFEQRKDDDFGGQLVFLAFGRNFESVELGHIKVQHCNIR